MFVPRLIRSNTGWNLYSDCKKQPVLLFIVRTRSIFFGLACFLPVSYVTTSFAKQTTNPKPLCTRSRCCTSKFGTFRITMGTKKIIYFHYQWSLPDPLLRSEQTYSNFQCMGRTHAVWCFLSCTEGRTSTRTTPKVKFNWSISKLSHLIYSQQ